MDLPTLLGQLSKEEKETMAKKLSEHRQRYRLAVKNTISHSFQIGERVLVFITRTISSLLRVKLFLSNRHLMAYLQEVMWWSLLQGFREKSL